jgi:hypothetical protein
MIGGVSTGRVDELAQAMGFQGMSKCTVYAFGQSCVPCRTQRQRRDQRHDGAREALFVERFQYVTLEELSPNLGAFDPAFDDHGKF